MHSEMICWNRLLKSSVKLWKLRNCLNCRGLHCNRVCSLFVKDSRDRLAESWLGGGLGEEKVGRVYNLCCDCHWNKQTTERFSQCFYTIQFMPVLCAPRAGLGAGCPVPMTMGDAVGVSLSHRSSDPHQTGCCWANIHWIAKHLIISQAFYLQTNGNRTFD